MSPRQLAPNASRECSLRTIIGTSDSGTEVTSREYTDQKSRGAGQDEGIRVGKASRRGYREQMECRKASVWQLTPRAQLSERPTLGAPKSR